MSSSPVATPQSCLVSWSWDPSIAWVFSICLGAFNCVLPRIFLQPLSQLRVAVASAGRSHQPSWQTKVHHLPAWRRRQRGGWRGWFIMSSHGGRELTMRHLALLMVSSCHLGNKVCVHISCISTLKKCKHMSLSLYIYLPTLHVYHVAYTLLNPLMVFSFPSFPSDTQPVRCGGGLRSGETKQSRGLCQAYGLETRGEEPFQMLRSDEKFPLLMTPVIHFYDFPSGKPHLEVKNLNFLKVNYRYLSINAGLSTSRYHSNGTSLCSRHW